MSQTFIYDLPTRVFHWLFALLFIVAFTIGTTVDDDDLLFSYHMLAGFILCFVVVVRIIWGILGTKYSRFTEFSLHPRDLALYFKGILVGNRRKWTGHNPASSWAALAMMTVALGLGVTGYLMTTGQGGEDLEEIHEILANAFLVLVILHLAGLVIHAMSHRDSLWMSMFSGQKKEIPDEKVPVRSYRALAIVWLLATVWLTTHLIQNFDAGTRELTVFGSRLQLGEAEEAEEHREHDKGTHKSKKKHGKHDDD